MATQKANYAIHEEDRKTYLVFILSYLISILPEEKYLSWLYEILSKDTKPIPQYLNQVFFKGGSPDQSFTLPEVYNLVYVATTISHLANLAKLKRQDYFKFAFSLYIYRKSGHEPYFHTLLKCMNEFKFEESPYVLTLASFDMIPKLNYHYLPLLTKTWENLYEGIEPDDWQGLVVNAAKDSIAAYNSRHTIQLDYDILKKVQEFAGLFTKVCQSC